MVIGHSRYTWKYVYGESRGYNMVGAFERTLMNFGLLTPNEECDQITCYDFAEKWELKDADQEVGE